MKFKNERQRKAVMARLNKFGYTTRVEDQKLRNRFNLSEGTILQEIKTKGIVIRNPNTGKVSFISDPTGTWKEWYKNNKNSIKQKNNISPQQVFSSSKNLSKKDQRLLYHVERGLPEELFKLDKSAKSDYQALRSKGLTDAEAKVEVFRRRKIFRR